jgi:hypothetical protein
MKPIKHAPPVQFLSECFTYDPEDGRLFWKERPRLHFKNECDWKTFNTRWAGREAGSKYFRKTSGEPANVIVCIVINGKHERFTAHRLIYELMGIPIPIGLEVDHRDTNPFNNRWHNLRLATRAQNNANQKPRNRKLPKGVYPHEGRFQAKITHDGKQIPIGRYITPELAQQAYMKKATDLFGEFARGN